MSEIVSLETIAYLVAGLAAAVVAAWGIVKTANWRNPVWRGTLWAVVAFGGLVLAAAMFGTLLMRVTA